MSGLAITLRDGEELTEEKAEELADLIMTMPTRIVVEGTKVRFEAID